MTARKFKIKTQFNRAGKPVNSREEIVAFGNDYQLNLKGVLSAAGFHTSSHGDWRYPYHEWDGQGPEEFVITVTEVVDDAVPEWVGQRFKAHDTGNVFIIVPEIEDVSPHGTVGQATQVYRRLYIESGKSIRIGDRDKTKAEMLKWVYGG